VAIVVLSLLVLIIFVFLSKIYTSKGFLKANNLDEKDSQVWEFTDEGIIKGAEGFTIEGTSETCWTLVHGYTSTPPVYKTLAKEINKKFNDTVYVPRLKGHGMLPSNILQYNIEDWYNEIENTNCDYMVGSSMMAALTLKYAEEHDPKKVVVIGTYIKAPTTLGSPFFINIAHTLRKFSYKNTVGTIDDPEGRKVHIATWGFPLKEVVNFHKNYEKEITKNAKNIKAEILFIHASKDTVASLDLAKEVYNNIQSKKKFVETKGNHLILRDYDKDKAIEEILNFRN